MINKLLGAAAMAAILYSTVAPHLPHMWAAAVAKYDESRIRNRRYG